jgi:hypothetical protein
VSRPAVVVREELESRKPLRRPLALVRVLPISASSELRPVLAANNNVTRLSLLHRLLPFPLSNVQPGTAVRRKPLKSK